MFAIIAYSKQQSFEKYYCFVVSQISSIPFSHKYHFIFFCFTLCLCMSINTVVQPT